VEVFGHVSVPLVGLLHERQQHIFIAVFPRIFTGELDSILGISPVAVWKRERGDTFDLHCVILQRVGWVIWFSTLKSICIGYYWWKYKINLNSRQAHHVVTCRNEEYVNDCHITEWSSCKCCVIRSMTQLFSSSTLIVLLLLDGNKCEQDKGPCKNNVTDKSYRNSTLWRSFYAN